MGDPPRHDLDAGPGAGSTTGPPRWVILSGIAALALVIVIVVLLLSGGGGSHGPARHSSFGDAAGPANGHSPW